MSALLLPLSLGLLGLPICGVLLLVWAVRGANRRSVELVLGLYSAMLLGWVPVAWYALTYRGVDDGSGPPHEPVFSSLASAVVLGLFLGASLVVIAATATSRQVVYESDRRVILVA